MSDLPGIGHNQPSAFERAAELVANANKWAQQRPEIADEEQAGACQLAIDQLRACKEDLEKAAKAERQPHDAAIAEIRTRYRDPLEMIGIAMTKLQQLAGRWLAKKRERVLIEQRERERAAQEAAQKASDLVHAADGERTVEADLAAKRAREDADRLAREASKPVGRARIKGEYADKAMSLRENWSAEVTDETLALRTYAKDPQVRRACLEKALQLARALAREKKREDAAPAGFRFFKTEKAV